MKKCPKCSATAPSDAWLCSCGYEFSGSEPVVPDSAANTPRQSTSAPTLAASAVLTFLTAVIFYAANRSQISHPDFTMIVIALVLCYCGFLSLFVCIRILRSPDLSWPAKLFSVFFVAIGVVLLGGSLLFGGCATRVFHM